MKHKILTFKDFESETLDKKAQKIIRGGDEEPPINPPTGPVKNGGGGNG
ncbi:rSAM-modified peptide [Flavobacterium sp. 3-218]